MNTLKCNSRVNQKYQTKMKKKKNPTSFFRERYKSSMSDSKLSQGGRTGAGSMGPLILATLTPAVRGLTSRCTIPWQELIFSSYQVRNSVIVTF